MKICKWAFEVELDNGYVYFKCLADMDEDRQCHPRDCEWMEEIEI